MKTSDFNFDLPAELLAEHPSEHRDEARLMVLTEKLKLSAQIIQRCCRLF
jgi:S-adenosylmethionine:tRNA-ribosyltransferase-isomerase (queuine synthetase)